MTRYLMSDGRTLGTCGRYADVNGARFYYEIHGSGEPLLLMIGGLDTLESLHAVAAELSRHYCVIMAEWRGHGRTPDTAGPFSYRQDASDMAALLAHLAIPTAHCVGYSDGAIAAFFMALHFPDRVNTIVSISGNYHRSGLSSRFAATMGALTAESFRRHNRVTADIYARVSPDGEDHFPILFEKVKRLWLTQPTLSRKDLTGIACPALVMAGDKDLISHVHTVNLFTSLPKGELSIIPAATHGLTNENPEEVSRVILHFLRRHAHLLSGKEAG